MEQERERKEQEQEKRDLKGDDDGETIRKRRKRGK